MPYISSIDLKETPWKIHRKKKVHFFATELPPPTEGIYLPFIPKLLTSQPCPFVQRSEGRIRTGSILSQLPTIQPPLQAPAATV